MFDEYNDNGNIVNEIANKDVNVDFEDDERSE